MFYLLKNCSLLHHFPNFPTGFIFSKIFAHWKRVFSINSIGGIRPSGSALALTAILMALRQSGMLDILGEGNTALGLSGVPLIASAIGLFFCGVGQSMGVGFYAPCMAIVYFAGMDPLVSFSRL